MNFRKRCWRSECTKHGLASILPRQVRALAISASVRFSFPMLSVIVIGGSVKLQRKAQEFECSCLGFWHAEMSSAPCRTLVLRKRTALSQYTVSRGHLI